MTRRKSIGCHGNGTATHFKGTRYETNTCPRRTLIDNPELSTLMVLHRVCGGKPGIEALKELTLHTLQSFAIIDDANAASTNEQIERDRKAQEVKR